MDFYRVDGITHRKIKMHRSRFTKPSH